MNQTSHIDHVPAVPPARPLPPGARRARIAVICARWHHDIVAQARDGLCDELARQGWPPAAIDLLEVPGAFEIPLQAQRLARGGRHAAVVAIALVVDGGIYRHEFVAATVVDALMRVQLDTDVPVLSVVLTPQAFHEHETHRQFFLQHFVAKGREAAQACLGALAACEVVAKLTAS
ncbi:MAG TPA: 6,7-dimethyl-8-ribityllumazine synthase [Rubrivivax sp.]|jgi:6,7-dimethyl-8-ribityllumazine synthase|nr:6,7-dimethyl-8-ribityllumazine synthase [Rubrivivax sp.]